MGGPAKTGPYRYHSHSFKKSAVQLLTAAQPSLPDPAGSAQGVLTLPSMLCADPAGRRRCLATRCARAVLSEPCLVPCLCVPAVSTQPDLGCLLCTSRPGPSDCPCNCPTVEQLHQTHCRSSAVGSLHSRSWLASSCSHLSQPCCSPEPEERFTSSLHPCR